MTVLTALDSAVRREISEPKSETKNTARFPSQKRESSRLTASLPIPTALNDWGMSPFEIQDDNLRQEMARQRELFRPGYITQAAYELTATAIDRQLRQLQPSAQPEAIYLKVSSQALEEDRSITET